MNPGPALADALLAPAPHPDLVPHLGLFSSLIGSWDVVVTQHLPDGKKQLLDAEWHFGWALEGRAIMDVWIAPRRSLRTASTIGGDYGVTVRFFDEAIGAWRSTWVGPVKRIIRPFTAWIENGEIILEGRFEEQAVTRWIFSEIAADSFRWRNIESRDDWKTHANLQEMQAKRSGVSTLAV